MSASPPKSRFDRLCDVLESQGPGALTPSERASFAMTWLFRETYNGGLHQFFFNDAGRLAADALRGLEMIGAPAAADILRRAMSVFPASVVPEDQAARRHHLCSACTEDQEELLSALTTEFFQNKEPVAELFDDYVARRPEEFPR